jgi:hypothetical protein
MGYPYPDHWPKRYNVCSDPCDLISGPCCCGAWHDAEEEEWIKSVIVSHGLVENPVQRLNRLLRDEIADAQLEMYKGFCEEINRCGKATKQFNETIEKYQDECLPTVEENQKKRTDDNLRSVFRGYKTT